MENEKQPKHKQEPPATNEVERLAMRLQDLADTKNTPNAAEDTAVHVESLDPIARDKYEKLQNVVNYVERIAGLASAVEEQKSAAALGAFGRFELLSELGAGGFAQVYLAHDPTLDRFVALKIPHLRKLSNENARLRFEREARAAALLSHPSIVPIFEAGTIDSVAYIASELCDGETLSDWIQRQQNPIDPRFAATLLATLADAMQYSHLRGIVHRDLKPSNVMLPKVSEEKSEPHSQVKTCLEKDEPLSPANSARILDFGLAKPIFRADDDELTQAGEVVGTPAYMAPELASGNETTPQSDIYSLGVILYLLLTGQLPHSGQSTLEILKSLESKEPKAPRRLDASIPRDLEAIAMKCLRKDPADRYDDALSLHNDLTNWLNARPVSARPATLFEQARMWYRREPRVANALLLATLILIAGLAGTAWQWREAILYRNDAELAMIQAKRSQQAVVESVSKQARMAVTMFDEYGKIDQWLKQNPDGAGLREKVQVAVDRVNESDGKGDSHDNWLGMTDEQMTMGAGLAVMMLSRDYWKQNRYDEAIDLVTEATKTHRNNRVCIGIYGGTLSFLYGRHEKDRQLLLDAGYPESEIDKQRETLRLASLDCLKRASEIGSLWLDQENWGAIFDDPDFKQIVENSRYPVIFDKMSSRKMLGTITKSMMSQGFKSLFGGRKAKDESDAESSPAPETEPIPDE